MLAFARKTKALLGLSKPKSKPDEESGKRFECVVTSNLQKLIMVFTIILSDMEFLFTILACVAYSQAGGIFLLMIGVIGFFILVYAGGCVIAARESAKFRQRFTEKVRLNEISGVTIEDITDALDGRRIFWSGPAFEAARTRQEALDALRAAAAYDSAPADVDIPTFERALREAELAGAGQLRRSGNPTAGAREMQLAAERLRAAHRARLEGPGAPDAKGAGETAVDAPEAAAAAAAAAAAVADDDEDDAEDFHARLFDAELAAAEEAGDAKLVKMLQLAAIRQLDSYRVDASLVKKASKGRLTEDERLHTLYAVCEAKHALHSYHAFARAFSRRILRPSHSLPFYRLFEYGWQPSVSHTDFAGVLNANALYSFTAGFVNIFFAFAFVVRSVPARIPALCETEISLQCTIIEDFQRPNVQANMVLCALLLGVLSLVLSVANIMLDIPARLFDHAEKEEESVHLSLQAEQATKTWEDKLQVEVQEHAKRLLRSEAPAGKYASLPDVTATPGVPGDEHAGLIAVLEDVLQIERRALTQKVRYIEHYLTTTEDEKRIRNDLRDGKRRRGGQLRAAVEGDTDEDDDVSEDSPAAASAALATQQQPSFYQQPLRQASATPEAEQRELSRAAAAPLPPSERLSSAVSSSDALDRV